MGRRVVAFLGTFFLGVFAGMYVDANAILGQQPIYQWLCLALAVLLFIAAAFVGRPVKKESTEG